MLRNSNGEILIMFPKYVGVCDSKLSGGISYFGSSCFLGIFMETLLWRAIYPKRLRGSLN